MRCPKCHADNSEASQFCADCGTELFPAKDADPVFTETLQTPIQKLTAGSTFAGRYQVIEELGQGGMGRVYKVFDTKVGEKIALKLLRHEATLDRDSLERFSNELKLARKVRHKNVCQMFDLGEAGGIPYITMEYVHGEDLRQLIRKVGRLSPGQAVAIARQVCAGLEEAHQLGVVHRDLKPQNIMLDEDGNVRIMDFGIARSLVGQGLTEAGLLVGTPEYMSPEQVEGENVDPRSDLYSLGVVLYEMVAGRRPFEGGSALSIAHKQRYEAPRDPRTFSSEIPEGLASIILKCLNKDKASRFESARALGDALASIEAALPVAETDSPKSKGGRTRARPGTFRLKKAVVPAMVVLATAVAAVMIVKVLSVPKKAAFAPLSSGKPSIAVLCFDNQTEKADLDRMAVTLLTTNLSRNEDIEVASTQRLFDILKGLGRQDARVIDRSLATEVAKRAGVQIMLLGSIVQIEGRIRLASELIDVRTGAIIGAQSADGTKYEDLFPMVDGITEQVGRRFGGGAGSRRLRITDAGTSSLAALEQYQKGLDLILRFDNASAVHFLRRAVEIDPKFATAYAYLALAELSTMITVFDPYADLTEAQSTIESARELAGQAPAGERLVIQMIEALLNRDLTNAGAFGRELLARKIPEKWAYMSIINEQWRRRDYRGAIQTAERMREDDPSEGNAYNGIAYSFGFLGDYAAAISALEKYRAVQPDVANAYDSAWELSLWAGRSDEAIRYADEALRVQPALGWPDHLAGWAFLHKADGETARERFRRLERGFPAWRPTVFLDLGLSYLSEGRYRDAQDAFLRALTLAREDGQKREEMMWRFYLGEAMLIRGNPAQALAEFRQAEEASAQYYRHGFNPIPLTRRFYEGRAFLKQERIGQAASASDEISRLIKEKGLPAEYLDFRHLLDAEIALVRNRTDDALRILGQTGFSSWHTSPFYWRSKAAAEEALGHWELAAACYGKFLGFVSLAREEVCDPVRYFYELSMADYNLGRVAEKMNNGAAAKDHYRRFLERMLAADPGIPEIEDARLRLAALR